MLNFGLAAPIDVQLSGPDYRQLHAAAQQVARIVRELPDVADTFVPQESGYPTLDVKVDRREGGAGWASRSATW